MKTLNVNSVLVRIPFEERCAEIEGFVLGFEDEATIFYDSGKNETYQFSELEFYCEGKRFDPRKITAAHLGHGHEFISEEEYDITGYQVHRDSGKPVELYMRDGDTYKCSEGILTFLIKD